MNQPNVLILNLEGDAFGALRGDFNRILKTTLNNMEQKESETAEITVKLKINLREEQTPDLDISSHSAMRDISVPSFTHKVSSVMQIKDEASGFLRGEYELVWDRELGDYVMRPIDNGQQTIDDYQKPLENEEDDGISAAPFEDDEMEDYVYDEPEE